MEEIAGQKNHVDIPFLGQAHNLVKGFPTVVAPNRIALVIADMIVRGDQDTDCVSSFCILAKCNH